MEAILEPNVVRSRYEVHGWGVGELWTRKEVVLAHEFDFGMVGVDRSEPESGTEGLVRRMRAFLKGEDVRFDDVPLDLGSATPFQLTVTETLRAVPRGEVVSYGELAALAGYPGAQRAVGTFCSRNRFMFLVPCHRVVAADGIGSYGAAGVTIKRRLLALEGVRL